MSNKLNFDNYVFRASQASKLLVGDIGITKLQEKRIGELKNERDKGINANGNKVKWTDTKEQELKKLIFKRDKDPIPKTIKTELRKIYRQEKHNRRFVMTNKYLQKGIIQEEEGITVYERYRNEVQGIPTLFKNNTIRLSNEYLTGEWDLDDENDWTKANEGFDIKCSWDLETFPLKGDKLDKVYETQNQCYMDIINKQPERNRPIEKWTTVYVLVNAIPEHLNQEKNKYFWAYGAPSEELDPVLWERYKSDIREVEKNMIFDRKRFVEQHKFQSQDLEISQEEWDEMGYDIPIEDRVVEKTVYYNEHLIKELYKRIEFSRNFLNELTKEK